MKKSTVGELLNKRGLMTGSVGETNPKKEAFARQMALRLAQASMKKRRKR